MNIQVSTEDLQTSFLVKLCLSAIADCTVTSFYSDKPICVNIHEMLRVQNVNKAL